MPQLTTACRCSSSGVVQIDQSLVLTAPDRLRVLLDPAISGVLNGRGALALATRGPDAVNSAALELLVP